MSLPSLNVLLAVSAASVLVQSANGQTSPRIEFAPEVASIISEDGARSQLARNFVKFSEALLSGAPQAIDAAVTSNARFHELEAAGYPPGPDGLKKFRTEMNAAFPDEHVTITAMRFEGDNMIETDLDVTATHVGPLMGVAPTGRKVRFTIHTRNRFEGDRMAERWDRTDFADLMRQLTQP